MARNIEIQKITLQNSTSVMVYEENHCVLWLLISVVIPKQCMHVCVCVCVCVLVLWSFFKFSLQCCVLFLEGKASQQSGDMSAATYERDRQTLLLSFRLLHMRLLVNANLNFSNSLKLLTFDQVKPPLRLGEPGLLPSPRSCPKRSEPGREHHLFEVNRDGAL